MKLLTKNILLLFFFALITFTFNSCKKDRPLVFFSVDDDIQLGMQTRDEIAKDPTHYPLLDSASNVPAYQYLYKIRNKILNTGEVYFKDKFAWQLRIVKDDNTLNAFCTPGGYIYVYTGLLKYLDSEDELAGVLGHEMAHADRRHTSQALQAQYGVTLLLNIVLGGDSSTLKNIAANLYLLKNSREHETEADKYSVTFLCKTDYNSAGAAGFFDKLIKAGYDCASSAYFSTHPNSCDRVEQINAQKAAQNCSGSATYDADYQNFKKTLP